MVAFSLLSSMHLEQGVLSAGALDPGPDSMCAFVAAEAGCTWRTPYVSLTAPVRYHSLL